MKRRWWLVLAGVVGVLGLFGRGGIDPFSFTVFRDGCPVTLWSTVAVSGTWVSFIQFDGARYDENFVSGFEMSPEHLEARVGSVRCNIFSVRDAGYDLRDGDSSWLAPGTELWSVKGYSPSFRIAAVVGDSIFLHETWPRRAVGTGRDVIGDADQPARALVIRSGKSEAVIATIDDPAEVKALVADLLDSPIDTNHHYDGGPRHWVVIEMESGPPLTVLVSVDEKRASPGLALSDRFVNAIVSAATG